MIKAMWQIKQVIFLLIIAVLFYANVAFSQNTINKQRVTNTREELSKLNNSGYLNRKEYDSLYLKNSLPIIIQDIENNISHIDERKIKDFEYAESLITLMRRKQLSEQQTQLVYDIIREMDNKNNIDKKPLEEALNNWRHTQDESLYIKLIDAFIKSGLSIKRFSADVNIKSNPRENAIVKYQKKIDRENNYNPLTANSPTPCKVTLIRFATYHIWTERNINNGSAPTSDKMAEYIIDGEPITIQENEPNE